MLIKDFQTISRFKKWGCALCVATLIFLPHFALAQTSSAKNIAPIISLLLSDEPLKTPIYWNGSRLNQDQSPRTREGTLNQVSVDLDQLPNDFIGPVLSVTAEAIGECYLLEASTLDSNLRLWDVVPTGPGRCTINILIQGAGSQLSDSFTISIANDPQANSFIKLIAEADSSEGDAKIAGSFAFTNITPWVADASLSSNPGAVFKDSNVPNLYEFTAVHDGVNMKGVMLTTKRKVDGRNFNSLNVDSRMSVRFVNGVPALIGSGKVTGSGGNTNTFAFIATGDNQVLSGPVAGKEFNVGGKNKLNALCVQDRLVGFSVFDNDRTLSKVSTSFVGFTNKDCTANNNRFVGETGVFADFQAINTHIGTILRGRGTAHKLDNGRISTVQDQDENDPDYAMYFLGLPEGLSDSHQIYQLDNDAVLADNVFVLDPFAIAKIAKIRRASGTMIFREPPEILQGVSVGDIILGKPSSRLKDGFMRQVTATGQQGGLFFLQTQPARLDQVFTVGGFSLDNKQLFLEDLEEVIVPRYTEGDVATKVSLGHEKIQAAYQQLRAQQQTQADSNSDEAHDKKSLNLPLPSVNFDHIFADADNNFSTTDDQWRTEGIFELLASITVRFKCRKAFCSKPEFLLKFDFEENFELSGHVFTDSPVSLNERHTINSWTFGSIWIGPIQVRPQIDLNLYLQGNTDTDMEWGIDQYFTAELGIELDDGNWSTINNQSFGIDAAPTPDYQANDGDADLRARVALDGSVKVSGIKVGGADAGIYTDVEASTPRSPIWEVTAGLNSEAYIEIDLLLTTIEGGPFELFDIPFNIQGGEASNQPADIKKILVNGIKVRNGRAERNVGVANEFGIIGDFFAASESDPLDIKVKVLDPETGFDCCSVQVVSDIDGVLGSKTSGQAEGNFYKFPITSMSPGTHNITVSALPDGEGASANQVLETFEISMIPSVALPVTNCTGIDLSFSNGSLSATVTEPATVLMRTEMEGCIQGEYEVEFFENTNGRISVTPFLTTQTTVNSGGAIPVSEAFATVGASLTEGETREFVVRHTSQSGDRIESNSITLTTQTPFTAQSAFNAGNSFEYAGVGGFYSGNAPLAKSTLAPQSQSLDPTSLDFSMQSADAPSNTNPHRLGLNNWGVGETVFIRNPFPLNANYEISWRITDDNATIATNTNGDVQITAATPGWHRVTAVYTHTSARGFDRQYRAGRLFYISPNTNVKWRGYEQEPLDSDATLLNLMNVGLGETNE